MEKLRGVLTLVMVLTVSWNISVAQNTLPDSGRVGIGTLNPNYLLDVAGDAQVGSLIINGQIYSPTVESRR